MWEGGLRSGAGRVLVAFVFLAAAMTGAGCGGGGSTASGESEAGHPASQRPESGGGGGSTASGESEAGGHPASQRLESGEVSFFLLIDNDTAQEELNTRASVSFWRQSKGEARSLDAKVESIGVLNGSSAEFSADLIYTPRRAVLEYGGQSYELDPIGLGGNRESATACERGLRRSAPQRLLQGAVKHRAGKTIGDLDVAVAERMLTGLAREGACGKQLQAFPFGPGLAQGVGAALDTYGIKSRVEVGTREDGSFRHLYIRAFLHPSGGFLHPSPREDEYDGLLELTLARVGEVKPIPTPPPARPMEALTKKLGAAKTKELEAGARGLVSLTWAAIGR
jgi:hypothetical protein